MNVVVTGGAGFIGSNLTDDLLASGHQVRIIDNFSTGQRPFLSEASSHPNCDLFELDLFTQSECLLDVIHGTDIVVHLAANADVRFGWDHPGRDLEQNVVATHNVLEAMRTTGVRRILFSSTGSVYGEASVIPTPEDAPFPVQTSLYGASKLAAEGLLQAYAEGAGFEVTIFRFVSVMGARYTHGHVVDFVRKLRRDPSKLEILGDGSQRKSYMDVSDCIAAVTAQLDRDHRCEVFNLGVDDYCSIAESAGWICARLGVDPELVYSGGDRGWVGDNPFIFLDTAKARAAGWETHFSIREAVERTVDYLVEHPWVVDLQDAP